jgi:hypothetical protein
MKSLRYMCVVVWTCVLRIFIVYAWVTRPYLISPLFVFATGSETVLCSYCVVVHVAGMILCL